MIAIAVALLLTVLLEGLAPRLFQNVDERSGEWVWRLASSVETRPERRLVIVDIDEESLARIGSWPWSRKQLADLLNKLSAIGAGPVAFDVVFPDARPDDRHLADALKSHPAVLAQIFSINTVTPVAGQLQGGLPAIDCASPIAEAAGYIGNTATLNAPAGHITPRIDPDGAVRKIPALLCYQGQAYPALGLVTLLRAAGSEDGYQLSPSAKLLSPPWYLSHPMLPGTIPLDENGDIRLSYRLPREAFTAISAADILEDRAPAHLLRGAVVLVGATAFGLGDVVPTPHGGAVGGVEVHAQFIAALLDDRLPYRPNGATRLSSLAALLGLSLLLAISAAARKAPDGTMSAIPAWALPLAALILGSLFLASHATLLLTHHLWFGWAMPASFILLTGLLLATVEHARTRFERERLYGNLSAYLPATVAREIAFNKVSGAIEAERREISVLFADIRNFSAYCEGRPPDETAALLQAFFTTSSRVIKAYDGVIEEFVGDAVMAVWNAPSACPDHPVRAYAAANALLKECSKIFPEIPPPGLEPLAVGIGLEVGDALVGSFGPAERRTHAALGETVTVASRLTSMTSELAYPLLVGEKAAERLASLPAVPGLSRPISLGSFLLEGLRRPRQVFGLATQQENSAEIIPLRSLRR